MQFVRQSRRVGRSLHGLEFCYLSITPCQVKHHIQTIGCNLGKPILRVSLVQLFEVGFFEKVEFSKSA